MSSGNAVRSLPLTKAEPTGLALMREPFKPHQIGKLPKPMAKRDVMDRLPKHHCELCGQYHATSKVMHLDYVGHAALTDRLLDADPNWTWEPVAFGPDGLPAMDTAGGMSIKLTVCGQVRLGYGHAAGKTGGDAVKEIIGDALRNAAMRFGAALDLWHKGELHEPSEQAPEEYTPPSDAFASFADQIAEAADEAALMEIGNGIADPDRKWTASERAGLKAKFANKLRELRTANGEQK